MSAIVSHKRSALETPSSAAVATQLDGNKSADGVLCWVDEFGVPWYYGEQRVALAADLSGVTTTTLADVTGLVFPVRANRRYDFDFDLIFQVAGTSGIKVGLTIPAASTLFNALVRIWALKTAPAVSMDTGIINASGGSVSSTGTLDTGVNARARVRGTLVNGANAGAIQLQWAAATAGAGAVTPKQGSNGRLWAS
jgi:hypothetical protein